MASYIQCFWFAAILPMTWICNFKKKFTYVQEAPNKKATLPRLMMGNMKPMHSELRTHVSETSMEQRGTLPIEKKIINACLEKMRYVLFKEKFNFKSVLIFYWSFLWPKWAGQTISVQFSQLGLFSYRTSKRFKNWRDVRLYIFLYLMIRWLKLDGPDIPEIEATTILLFWAQ